jgi:hypothetical protein
LLPGAPSMTHGQGLGSWWGGRCCRHVLRSGEDKGSKETQSFCQKMGSFVREREITPTSPIFTPICSAQVPERPSLISPATAVISSWAGHGQADDGV